MPAFVALFRAINVGGRSTVTMADLRTMATGLGLGKPRTILQTGNLVFSTNEADLRELATRIEAAALAVLGLETRVLVRSPAKWDALVAALPFPDFAREHPSHLLAMPLQDEPSQTAEAALRAAVSGNEQVALRGSTAYLAYPDGVGRSKLTMALVERRLGTLGTGRNWNSVTKIAAALSA